MKRLTTVDRLEEAKKELKTTRDKVKFFESLEYLECLWETADYPSLDYDENSIIVRKYRKLFGSLDINYYVEKKKNDLLRHIKSSAKHFKDMTDKWPHWKQESYKHSKIFQNLYNKYMKDVWSNPWNW